MVIPGPRDGKAARSSEVRGQIAEVKAGRPRRLRPSNSGIVIGFSRGGVNESEVVFTGCWIRRRRSMLRNTSKPLRVDSFRPFRGYNLSMFTLTACEVAHKVLLGRSSAPQRLKPNLKQRAYRSGEPLRHPKAEAISTFPQRVAPWVLLLRRFAAFKSLFCGLQTPPASWFSHCQRVLRSLPFRTSPQIWSANSSWRSKWRIRKRM
jgi:hypothetical protein